MQDRLERGMAKLGDEVRRNVRVGPRSARIGDIDLLVFHPDTRAGIALSLKWYYPPYLVQEVASQAARLGAAVRKHVQILQSFREEHAQIRRSYRLPEDIDFEPIVVVYPGPVFERSRSADVGIVSGAEFLKLAEEANAFGEFVQAVRNYEAPRIRMLPTRLKVRLGKYTFDGPSYYIPQSEREALGLPEERWDLRIPWDPEAVRRRPEDDHRRRE